MSDGSKSKVHIAQQQEEEEVKGAQHRRGDQGPIIYLVNPETWLRPLLIICLHLGATTKVPPPKYQSATTKAQEPKNYISKESELLNSDISFIQKVSPNLRYKF